MHNSPATSRKHRVPHDLGWRARTLIWLGIWLGWGALGRPLCCQLVIGVVGAATEGRAALVAGLAGLLAGAFSMALGEWISVQSSRKRSWR